MEFDGKLAQEAIDIVGTSHKQQNEPGSEQNLHRMRKSISVRVALPALRDARLDVQVIHSRCVL